MGMKEEEGAETMTGTEDVMVVMARETKEGPEMMSVEGEIVMRIGEEDGQTEMEIMEEREIEKAGAPKKEIAEVQVNDTLKEIEMAGRGAMRERGMKKGLLVRGTTGEEERDQPREAWIG